MLGYLFGFNARISRVPFLLCIFALAAGLVLLAYGVTGTTPGSGRTDVLLVQAASSGPMQIAFFAALAITFMLQSMRVRDIGWDPVCVMVAWIALVVIDRLIASRYPEWAINPQFTGTLVGGLINAALMLALFVWPSGYSEASSPLPRDQGGTVDDFQRNNSAPAAAANRIARIANGEFGGRAK
ncbi:MULTISPECIES: hypothetical protein [unclassified Bradyrhizobium]|uniref:hypothetical protein n=1 Tax=unclassified Bradyrhizobium TaxID=2631580 RepID=UPI00247A000C|nr:MULTISPECIES: hypothetical protein [unclassified Bradyrhizobium]WGS21346.1 hypothetical protein MTX22_06320 [Bradyrhizobium sp. ISRA463]WGS28275.1 hypothetical protein MTX19_04170 [Bradyrhizobium sp. ISRA464]